MAEFTDTQRMDWLTIHIVEVRKHARYGSRRVLVASGAFDEEEAGPMPSNLRQDIDAAMHADGVAPAPEASDESVTARSAGSVP